MPKLVLRGYQETGASFLSDSEHALLADEMGLGKTIQVLAAIRYLIGTGVMSRALIVAPSSLQSNWMSELSRWFSDVPARAIEGAQRDRLASYRLPILVQVATYDQIRADSVELYNFHEFDLVVLDEAQRIKNSGSRSSVACRSLRRRRSWALTGTPLENHPNDLVSVFRFVRPNTIARNMSRSEMHGQIERYFLRRRAKDVLSDLPDKIEQEVVLDLLPRQRFTYRSELMQAPSDPSPSATVASMFATLTRLKQICNFDTDSGESSKLEFLRTVVEEASETARKVLVFSQYVSTLERIQAVFGERSLLFHGGLSTEERDAIVGDFRTNPKKDLLLISLRAGGVGLNLQEASVVVLFDRWWNPAAEEQAISRAHRSGQELPVIVYKLLVRNSIEQHINNVLEKKRRLFQDYIEDAPSRSSINADDLKAILTQAARDL